MNCPFCGLDNTRVTDSRPEEDGIRRRRECQACGRRFSTLERVELGAVMLVKKDGRREQFDRAKIISGLRKACEKRPIPSGAIEAVAAEIESEVQTLNKAEIPSTVVGEMVMDRLKTLDHIAYIRFASVYRAFADVDELEAELEALRAGWQRPDVPPDQMALLPDVARPTPRVLRMRSTRTDDSEPASKQRKVR